jgi:hypothetical protein
LPSSKKVKLIKLGKTEGKTEPTFEMDVGEEHLGDFQKAFPKALQKVKEFSEK